MRQLLTLLASAALLAACNNDLDVNADYKDQTVVYGLLNQRDSLHWVKINKAFLGAGNAFDMALVRDSSEYPEGAITDAMVFRINEGGTVIDSFPLRDTLVTDRLPGTFYSPVQRLHYFTTPFVQYLPPNNPTSGVRMFLQQNDAYRLRLRINGRVVTASTPITNDFSISAINQTVSSLQQHRVGLISSTGNYLNYEFKWNTSRDNKRFVVTSRFRFDEVTGTDTVAREYTSVLGTRISPNSSAIEELSVTLNGQAFFTGLAGYIKRDPSWSNVDKRIFRGLDFLVSVANDDLNTYLTLTEPVSGIVEDRPAYSNIDGALGVWGSRYTKNVIGKYLNGNTLEELKNGAYTSNLRFCSALDPGGAYSCN